MMKIDFDNILLNKLNEINLNEDNKIEKDIKDQISSLFSHVSINEDFFKSQIEVFNSEVLKNNITLHREFSSVSENLTKSINIAVAKNSEEIKKHNEIAEANISKLKAEYKLKQDEINEKILLEEDKLNIHLIDVRKIYQDEIIQINKEIEIVRENTSLAKQKIEFKFSDKIKKIEENFENFKTAKNQSLVELRNQYNSKIEEFKILLDENKIEKDNSYLTIKQTFNQASIKFNNFINEHKKHFEIQKQKIVTKNRNIISDLNFEIEDLNEYFEKAKTLIINEHQEKIKALNIVFDVQKNAHNKANIEIINKYNSKISTTNSELSINRDSINNQIKLLEKEKRDALKKAADIFEENKIYKDYNRMIKNLDNKLLQLVSERDKKVIQEELQLQKALYNHDIKNIKHLNEWRYNKNLYDKERDLNYQIYKAKYNNDFSVIKEKELLESKRVEIFNRLETLFLENNLLPIELQLKLSSSIQNRDINLLNIDSDSTKLDCELNIKLLEILYSLEELFIKEELEVEQNKKDFEIKLLRLTNQLELEKENAKRDHEIKNLELNINLQDYLHENKSKKYRDYFFLQKRIYLSHIDLLKNELDYNISNEKRNALLEEQKRNKISLEIKTKNQNILISKKLQRNIALLKIDSTYHEKTNILFLDNLLDLIVRQRTLIKDLFLLNDSAIHPEKIKSLIKLIIEFNDIYIKMYDSLITKYKTINEINYNNKVNDITEQKYRIKHESILNLHNEKISILKNTRNNISNEINQLLERSKEIEIESVQKSMINSGLQKNKSSDEAIFYSKTTSSLKLESKNNRIIIKKLYQQRALKEEEIKKINKKLVKQENTLKLKRKSEEAKYYRKYNINSTNFTSLLNQFDKYNILLNKNLSELLKDLYLNDIAIKGFQKRFKNIFIKMIDNSIYKFQNILKFWISFNLNNEVELLKSMNQFTDQSMSSLEKLEKKYNRFLLVDGKTLTEHKKIHLQNELNLKNKIASDEKLLASIDKTNHDLYNIKYREIEKHIEQNKAKFNTRLSLINENLKNANEYLYKDFEKISSKCRKKYHSLKTKILTNKILLEEEINDNKVKTEYRANFIIKQYETQKIKFYKTLKQSRKKYSFDIEKCNHLLKLNNDLYNKNVSDNKIKLKREIRQFNNELQLFKIHGKKDKHKLIRKDKKELRKNYRFKLKQIKKQR
ncbi:hypothetical protein [Haploplasma modicum]|uniref:hypothetical protein n=1 Tax=Haploplasma modicum TaxID=2150 RepID=UPI000AD26871|nr:hypothetical protein [Haploplasma modicum]